jgi:hypothetical protein
MELDESEMKKNLKRIIKAYNYLATEHQKNPLDIIKERGAAIDDIKKGLKEITILFSPDDATDIREC